MIDSSRTIQEVMQHLTEMKEQLRKLDEKLDNHIHSVHRAFPRNDLQEPDFDGHRVYHTTKKEESKTISSYKHSITNRILQGVTGFVLLLLGIGATSWFKSL